MSLIQSHLAGLWTGPEFEPSAWLLDPMSELVWGLHSGLCPQDWEWNAKLGQGCFQKTKE